MLPLGHFERMALENVQVWIDGAGCGHEASGGHSGGPVSASVHAAASLPEAGQAAPRRAGAFPPSFATHSGLLLSFPWKLLCKVTGLGLCLFSENALHEDSHNDAPCWGLYCDFCGLN